MPKLKSDYNISNVKDIEDVKRFLSIFIKEIAGIINGQIEVDKNLKVQIIEDVGFTTANAQKQVAHNLGRTPVGYIKCGSNVATSLYSGTTENSSEYLYLKSSAVATVDILVF